MASTVNKVRSKLPKRFRPLYDQAQTQSAIRYGSQQDALQSIFGRLTSDYRRSSQAQDDMGATLLGSLNNAGQNLTRVYSDAGLTPEVLATIGNSPTGQRIAAELARGQAGIAEQRTGALAGQQYIQQRLADDYREDVGQVNQQLTSMLKERGLYESSLLDELIGADRARRAERNDAVREQRFDAEQNILDRQASQDKALIGQGLLPDEKGNLQPLPGGKADPNVRKPKPRSKPSGADRSLQSDFRSASSWVKTLDEATKKKTKDPAKRRQIVQEILVKGDEVSGIPRITSAGLDAALDMFYDRAISPDTVAAIHNSGAKIKFLGGNARTRNQRRRDSRKSAGRSITQSGGTPDQQDRNRY